MNWGKPNALNWKACADQYSFYFVTLDIICISVLVVKAYFCKFSKYPLFLDEPAFREELLTLKVAFPSYCTFKMEDLTKLTIFGAQPLHIQIIF